MKILSLEEAEQLKKVIHSGEGWAVWEQRAKWLFHVRELYGKGFAICIPENILYDNFREMLDDLTEGK